MNRFFYIFYLPYAAGSLIGLWLIWQEPHLAWFALWFWLATGFLGIEVGFHRLFSHGQFETYTPIRYALALLGTLSGYGPLVYWCGSHYLHHKYTDTERDPTAPRRGFWHCVLTWSLKKTYDQEFTISCRPTVAIIRDKWLRNMDNHFIAINYLFFGILLLISWKVAFAGYMVSTLIEKTRFGLGNFVLHTGQYTEQAGKSRNWPWFTLVFGGFALHNNHHRNPRSINDSEHWWQVDLNAPIIWLIKKRT